MTRGKDGYKKPDESDLDVLRTNAMRDIRTRALMDGQVDVTKPIRYDTMDGSYPVYFLVDPLEIHGKSATELWQAGKRTLAIKAAKYDGNTEFLEAKLCDSIGTGNNHWVGDLIREHRPIKEDEELKFAVEAKDIDIDVGIDDGLLLIFLKIFLIFLIGFCWL